MQLGLDVAKGDIAVAVFVATCTTMATKRYAVRFAVRSVGAGWQAWRSPGFLAGRMRVEAGGAFWTLTSWASRSDMLAYRDSGIHARVMPRLAGWAEEAVFCVWTGDGGALPDWAEVTRRAEASPIHPPLDNPGAIPPDSRGVPTRRRGVEIVLPRRRGGPSKGTADNR